PADPTRLVAERTPPYRRPCPVAPPQETHQLRRASHGGVSRPCGNPQNSRNRVSRGRGERGTKPSNSGAATHFGSGNGSDSGLGLRYVIGRIAVVTDFIADSNSKTGIVSCQALIPLVDRPANVCLRITRPHADESAGAAKLLHGRGIDYPPPARRMCASRGNEFLEPIKEAIFKNSGIVHIYVTGSNMSNDLGVEACDG